MAPISRCGIMASPTWVVELRGRRSVCVGKEERGSHILSSNWQLHCLPERAAMALSVVWRNAEVMSREACCVHGALGGLAEISWLGKLRDGATWEGCRCKRIHQETDAGADVERGWSCVVQGQQQQQC